MPSERKVNMDSNKEETYLSFEERRIIETGIRHGSTKTAIAKTIGKDNSTVCSLMRHKMNSLFAALFVEKFCFLQFWQKAADKYFVRTNQRL